ncbi:helix-turn-helix domain-containing protein [Peribacillus alkalitolerans]|uniref:helix-turn-helix domain-containing protein n=1 Tax=Peribacillus alkalitolerans TaxID=1550385 RepID=UPI0013D8BF3A|nr:helix-turn-helix domain-containing protein [Peribacillus alkalitolerans]
MKNNFLAISIVLLSISLIYCSFQLSSSFPKKQSNSEVAATGLMNMEEAAEYLSIPVDDLETVIYQQDQLRKAAGTFNTYTFIPYIELRGKKYFNKSQVDEWIKEASITWQVHK